MDPIAGENPSERSTPALQNFGNPALVYRMAYWPVTYTIKGITHLLCKIQAQDLLRVPNHGPLILVSNHINFMEVPVVYTQLLPRPVTGFVKYETWNSRLLGPLFELWGAIPIHRGTADMGAMRMAFDALQAGRIVAIAPEGTRSNHGRLLPGHPGVVTVALHSGAPLLPLVYYGSEIIHQNLRRFQRTDFTIRVGRPFHLDPGSEKVDRVVRQHMTDEIMYQLAALLPAANRGVYANMEAATTRYLRFIDEN
jgi:1-acyl-sn-glycerol-3-phosphate acyltransferase